jgi:hypothetical protein
MKHGQLDFMRNFSDHDFDHCVDFMSYYFIDNKLFDFGRTKEPV